MGGRVIATISEMFVNCIRIARPYTIVQTLMDDLAHTPSVLHSEGVIAESLSCFPNYGIPLTFFINLLVSISLIRVNFRST